MSGHTVNLQDVDRTQVAIVGGKGANLGELSRIEGVHVPPGFCITTDAYARVMAEAAPVGDPIIIPEDLAAAIGQSLARFESDTAFAVRSSATSEDSPTASFAGQYDSYLGIVGLASVLDRVSRCWASLLSERAVTYRLRNDIDVRKVRMAVVVQRMVFPSAAGVLFTADPVSGNRKVAVVEAVPGLGDALVSGTTNADAFEVRDGQVVARPANDERRHQTLTDAQVLRLAALGRRIESHFGSPQDIEWCLADGDFQIVQSRPITTLFPIPEAGDRENHVYVSVGHQQMMTDPMKPLGISFWQMTTPRPMSVAGGRLFVDVTQMLASPASRANVLAMLGRSDPRIGDALQSVLDRGDFVRPLSDDALVAPRAGASAAPIETDPAIVGDLIASTQASIAEARREIASKSGPALFEFIRTDLHELKRHLFDPHGHRVFMSAMEAAWWLNDNLLEWLGERNAADTLTLSVSNNVTSEMGLALLNVADVIRPYPDVVAVLERADEHFLNTLPAVAGGREARDAILAWLDRYGMRGAGEIDITRPRWSEHPRALLPLILAHVRNFEADEARRRFEHGRQEAWKKEQEVLARVRALPGGEQKAVDTKWRIDRVRTFIGYREYPKYGMVSRYFIYKQALLREAERLVSARVLRDTDEIFYLSFDELDEVARTRRVDDRLIEERRKAFDSYLTLAPPRVLTSDGELLDGAYRRENIPRGALAGLAVSAGIVEGRARVLLDIADAALDPGDILVTAHTDPSWTPLFVGIAGLVTEVGGLMTHGAVIAREYGLPAVVGVERATRLIRDGQRIRIHGTEGYVEILH